MSAPRATTLKIEPSPAIDPVAAPTTAKFHPTGMTATFENVAVAVAPSVGPVARRPARGAGGGRRGEAGERLLPDDGPEIGDRFPVVRGDDVTVAIQLQPHGRGC